MGRYNIKTSPIAKKEAIIKGDKYRFTMLTSRMVRIEYSEGGIFEDRATQIVLNRDFPVPKFTVTEKDGIMEIKTEHIILTYHKDKEFTEHTLYAQFLGKNSMFHFNWHFGDYNVWHLNGTAKTIDGVDGECKLEPGIMSHHNFSDIDDSKSLVFDEEGWVHPREKNVIDWYIFAYADDFETALKDFYKLSGEVPLVPRYALGNWWSRFYRYNAEEYLNLMDRFKEEECPFSVAVVDTEWHPVMQENMKYGTGWTGWTWNKDLFPDPKGFIEEIHKRGFKTTLNLHFAEGVAPYESQYEDMAKAMDVTDGMPVKFDVADKKFMDNYFDIIIRPHEKDGIDFWWLDWQQRNYANCENMDPLWMINHYHSVDMQNENKRPMILSRYAGPGSHRYPLGFSGDSYSTWESLEFQPYLTATASNIGYTWWSHDIGGHLGGIRDDEMIARWVQFGVFSPINRLHSCPNEMMSKEPWNYRRETETVMKNFLRLRHALVPYLYTLNHKMHKYGEPLISPLYYKHPEVGMIYPDIANNYSCKFRNEYYFGSQMIVAPITKPTDNVTHYAYSDAYIPKGEWVDFFNGRRYKGEKTLRLYRDLYEYPVLVKAGGIIPMADDGIKNTVDNPINLKLRVFSGADNTFEMYEDDGISLDFEKGAFATTKFELKDKKEFIINKPVGDLSVIPETRNYEVEFNGYIGLNDFEVTVDNKKAEFEVKKVGKRISVIIKDVKGTVSIKFMKTPEIDRNNDKYKEAIEFTRRCYGTNAQRGQIYGLLKRQAPISDILTYFIKNNVDENMSNALLEILTASE